MKRLLLGLLMLFTSVGLFACDQRFEPIDYKEVDTLGQFENYSQIQDYLDTFYEDLGYYRNTDEVGTSFTTTAMAMTTTAMMNTPEASMQDQEKSYSETNDQVAGVRESDRFLTDGDFIYILRDNEFVIIDPANLEIMDSYQYSDGWLSGMYKYGQFIVLIGSEYHYEWIDRPVTTSIDDASEESKDAPYYYGYMRYNYGTRVLVLDISDKENIEKSKELYFEGSSLIDSRMIGDDCFLILNNYASNFGYDDDSSFIPTYLDSAESDELITLPARNIYYMPNNLQSCSFLLLASFEIDSDEPAQVDAYLGSSYQIYMSLDNLYAIVYRNSINQETGYYQYQTFVLRFAIDDGKLVYEAMGSVAGSPLNQFSMDEYDGYFRIATTNTTYSQEGFTIDNALYIYDATSKGALEPVSVLPGLGKPGERIFAARFMGDQALIVTFVQTDPLYNIDLSDPENPQVIGELYEEGVSDYLHPIDEGLSLGVGRQAVTESGFTYFTGVKVALYDISEDDPINLETYLVEGEYSYSPVTYDHKAFVSYQLPDADYMLVAIPVYEWFNQFYRSSQSVYVFKVHFAGDLEYLTKLTHMPSEPVGPDNEYYYGYYDSIERTLMIENMIFTVSYSRIQKYDMDMDFTLVDSLVFE